MTDDLMARVRQELTAYPAISKAVEELTDADRIALCIVAGCKMDYRLENTPEGGYRMVASTINPVGITKINGRFHVYERHPDINELAAPHK